VAHNYDMKSVMRWLVLSEAFARSDKISDLATKDMPEAGEVPRFSRYYSRPAASSNVTKLLTQSGQIRKTAGNTVAVAQARRDALAPFNRGAKTDGGQKVMELSGDFVRPVV